MRVIGDTNTNAGITGLSERISHNSSTLVGNRINEASSEVRSGRYIHDRKGFLSRIPMVRPSRRSKPIRGSREGNKLRVVRAATSRGVYGKRDRGICAGATRR